MLRRIYRMDGGLVRLPSLTPATAGVVIGTLLLMGCSGDKLDSAGSGKGQTAEPTDIARLAYDEAAQTVTVTLQNQIEYRYGKVIPLIYKQFQDADNRQHFFTQKLKGQRPLLSYSCPNGIDVESADFRRITFDPDSGTLFVQFDAHATFEYPNFPRELFDRLATAPSTQVFFSDHIRGKFGSQRL